MTPPPNRRAPGLLLAWLLIDASMGMNLWLDGPSTPSRILLAGGIALVLYVLLRRPAGSIQPRLERVEIAIGVALALELAARIAIPFRPEPPAPIVPIPALAAVALVALGVWLVARVTYPRSRANAEPSAANAASAASAPTAAGAAKEAPSWRTRLTWLAGVALPVVIVAGLAARFAIVAWDVEPGFDVHLIQEAAGRALLAGQNPYLTHIYDSGYPYWPLSAILAAGGLLFGDARWGLLVADATIVAAFVVIARNVGAPGRFGALAGALLLWNASGLYMTWQSLPEPAVIALASIGVAILTGPRPRGVLAGVAFGLGIATKQLGLGLLPFLPFSRSGTQRTAFLVATAVSAAIVLAFLALAPSQFIEGSIASHLVEPARDYAINLLDPLPGVIPRFTVPFVVTGALALGIGLAVRLRWPDAIDGWLAGSIALLFVAFALIGISFLNYYQIPLALMLILIMIPDGWTAEPRSPRAA
jgi:hypothetical protein